ncbi:hypothetical protein AAFF_G00219090 [Aldrovandia affinis]|uniref:Uncharacterized protein n=1 Tax=Aldrovandia affinis TaxID=143900 RepID=A0AAD7SW97_9TELE|nr:hypothetical protein AAFF_G00219090 [Aldrovandia affinis]
MVILFWHKSHKATKPQSTNKHTPKGPHLHVPEQLEDLHGPEDNVLNGLLADATQRCRVHLPRRLGWLPGEGRRCHAGSGDGGRGHGDGKGMHAARELLNTGAQQHT